MVMSQVLWGPKRSVTPGLTTVLTGPDQDVHVRARLCVVKWCVLAQITSHRRLPRALCTTRDVIKFMVNYNWAPLHNPTKYTCIQGKKYKGVTLSYHTLGGGKEK